MKTIWILNHYATPPELGPLIRHYKFAEGLIKNGYNVKIFAASSMHYTGENLISDRSKHIKRLYDGIPFIFIRSPRYKNNGVSRVFNMIIFTYGLFRVSKALLKNDEKPDVIYASSPHPLTLIAGIILGERLEIPCICEVRDLWPEVIYFSGRVKTNSFLGKLLLAGEHWIYKRADSIVFLKEGDTDYLKERKWTLEQGGNIDLNKCHYINNGVDINIFNDRINNDILEDEDLDNGKFNIVYTGAIRPVNNIGNILDTAKFLEDRKEIQFLIYGDGNQLEILKQRVDDERLTSVKMKGYVNKKYIPYILSRSSVNILNYSQSKYNWSRGNSSNKLFEYMASRKPIISNVKMGYSLIEKYDCGISLEEDTPEALAEAILDIYNMPEERYNEISNNARSGAEEFDYKILTKKLISVIENQTI